MKRALLTGATGFNGSHLAQHLTKQGWTVELVVRDASKLSNELRSLNTYEHDGSTAQMIEIVQASQPDVVFHLASLFLATHAPNDVEQLVTSNVLFSTQLLEAMAVAGVSRIINTGTSWQHFDETSPEFHSVNLYAATKTAFEAILDWYIEAKGFSAITLKLFDTFGDHDPRAKLVQLLLKTLKTGNTLSLSPGEQRIDLVHINDVVRAFTIAGERISEAKPGTHESFVVASRKPVSIKELVTALSDITGHVLPISFGERPYREREVMKPWSKGQLIPGWHAEISLEDGLRRILEATSK